MARKIFRVDAWIVGSDGTYYAYSKDYPKNFDSNNYDNDPSKALLRATGDFSDVKGAMCKRDDRKLQTVTLTSEDGFQIDKFTIGSLAEPEPVSNE